MSDRIGVMRDGQARAGRHAATRSIPRRNSKFVSEFMGDVNIIPVRADGGGKLQSADLRRDVQRAADAERHSPPAIWWSGRNSCASSSSREDAENCAERQALQRICARLAHPVSGARRRAGLHRREAAPAGLRQASSTSDVLIGWDAARLHPGERLMAEALAATARQGAGARAPRNALPLIAVPADRLRRAAAGGHRATASCRRAPSACCRRRPSRTTPTIFDSTSYISFLWSLGLAALTVDPAGADLLSGRLWAGARVRPLVDGADAALHHPALRLGERAALRLDPVLHQERRAARHAEVAVRRRARELAVHRRHDRARHGLCLSALHAVPDDARRRAWCRTRRARPPSISARRRWQVFREVELPLSMPGIIIGFLLTFVLAVGAIAEAKVLGGQTGHPDHPRHRDRLHLCAELAARRGARGAADAGRRRAGAAGAAALRPRRHPGAALMSPAERSAALARTR